MAPLKSRKSAVLDLIFINNPDCMTECSTRELEGVSDHKLATTKLNLMDSSNRDNQEEAEQMKIPEIGKGANQEKLRTALQNVDWPAIIGACQDENRDFTMDDGTATTDEVKKDNIK